MNGAQNEDDLIVIIVNFGVILARTQSYSSSINQTHTHRHAVACVVLPFNRNVCERHGTRSHDGNE